MPHELITIPGGGHGLGGGDKNLIAEAHARALEFVKEHLKQLPPVRPGGGRSPGTGRERLQ